MRWVGRFGTIFMRAIYCCTLTLSKSTSDYLRFAATSTECEQVSVKETVLVFVFRCTHNGSWVAVAVAAGILAVQMTKANDTAEVRTKEKRGGSQKRRKKYHIIERDSRLEY